MHAQILDAIIVLFLLLQTWLGWKRGLMWHAAGTVSIAAGILLGLAAAPFVGGLFMPHVTANPFYARLLAFILTAGIVGLTLRLICAWAEAKAEEGLDEKEKEERRSQDRILGGVFGALKGSVLALLISAAAASFWPQWDCWRDGHLAPYMARSGARMLPSGTEDHLRSWLDSSAKDLQENLEIRTKPQAVESPDKETAATRSNALGERLHGGGK